MKLVNTRFNGLKLIKGKTFYDKRGFLRETMRNNLYSGYYPSQKKILLEVCIYKKNICRLNLFVF